MTRGVQFFLILGVGLLILDGALFLLAMDRSPKADVTGPRVVSSGTAAIGGPFMLMAMDGKTVSDLTYRGKWMLIYFGYTSCPDACPTALTNMSIAIEKLEKEGIENDKLVPLFITVDPDRDTRSVVAEYLRSFDPWIVGLTGSQEQTDAAVKRYRVDVERHRMRAAIIRSIIARTSTLWTPEENSSTRSRQRRPPIRSPNGLPR